ncbi:MAG: adenine phosphoribosyltransferase, partial [Ilumatobacteraceae bacterium]
LEYGSDKLESLRDAVRPGERIRVVDDVRAPGGPAAAACRLCVVLGAEVVGLAVLIEIAGLSGRDRLSGRRVESVIVFD